MSTQGNPKLTIRMEPTEKAGFIADAYNAGTTGAELVVAFIRWWRGEPGAELPSRPCDRKETDRA